MAPSEARFPFLCLPTQATDLRVTRSCFKLFKSLPQPNGKSSQAKGQRTAKPSYDTWIRTPSTVCGSQHRDHTPSHPVTFKYQEKHLPVPSAAPPGQSPELNRTGRTLQMPRTGVLPRPLPSCAVVLAAETSCGIYAYVSGLCRSALYFPGAPLFLQMSPACPFLQPSRDTQFSSSSCLLMGTETAGGKRTAGEGQMSGAELQHGSLRSSVQAGTGHKRALRLIILRRMAMEEEN